jgi:hypothetical protein
MDSRTYKSSRLLARYILYIGYLDNVEIKARYVGDLMKYITSHER